MAIVLCLCNNSTIHASIFRYTQRFLWNLWYCSIWYATAFVKSYLGAIAPSVSNNWYRWRNRRRVTWKTACGRYFQDVILTNFCFAGLFFHKIFKKNFLCIQYVKGKRKSIFVAFCTMQLLRAYFVVCQNRRCSIYYSKLFWALHFWQLRNDSE